MSIQHEKELKELLKQNMGRLLRNPYEETAKVVISIAKRNDEPGLRANFPDGTYVNLINCNVEDFGIFHKFIIS